MKKNIFEILSHLPFTLGVAASGVVLCCFFGMKGMAGEITASVKSGLERDLITIEKEETQAVAEKSSAGNDADVKAPASTDSAGNGTNAEENAGGNGADSTQAPAARGSVDYTYDGSENTGDADHDTVLATENAPEVYADVLDEFGNVKAGAAAPAGTFTYQPATGVNTAFLSYEPQPVDSGYYQDPGQYTFTTAADYKTVDDSYFTDALFIGDSRTVGLFDYGQLPADFFCNRGYSAYSFVKGKTGTLQNTGAEMTLEQCLGAKQYKKVYIILGINDSGIGSREAFTERYGQLLDAVKTSQPDAVIYVCANMYFAPTFEDKYGVMNNTAVRDKNYQIARFADGQTTFYLNYNGMFCNEAGFLRPELTTDGAHLLGRYYAMWCQYFRHHAV